MEEQNKNYGKHIRIWVSGLIATTIFTVLMHVLDEEGLKLIEALVQGVIFYIAWVIVHYLFFNKLKY